MTEIAELLERNRGFTSDFHGADLPIVPKFRQIIVSCVDARVDPTRYFGLELGDAVVFRTLGGRVTDTLEQQIRVLMAFTGEVLGPDAPLPEITVVHHTDCGMERLADAGRREKLSSTSGVAEGVFADLAIQDHAEALETDVRRLRESLHLPGGLTARGYLYDHLTGAVRDVVSSDLASTGSA